MSDLAATLRDIDSPVARDVLRLAAAVREHPVFRRLGRIADVRVFMEHHVWAVWDFMSLLKSIQAEVAPSGAPWTPVRDPAAARFVNEIVLGEETDEGPDGAVASHFEIYVAAMDAAGARTAAIRAMTASIASGASWHTALAASAPPAAARDFVSATMEIAGASLAERVSAFTLGREDVIPGMFREAVARLDASSVRGADLRLFRWYLDRHVAVDGDHHGPLAARLFARTCLTDGATTDASLRAAVRALEQRVALWDAAGAAMDRD